MSAAGSSSICAHDYEFDSSKLMPELTVTRLFLPLCNLQMYDAEAINRAESWK